MGLGRNWPPMRDHELSPEQSARLMSMTIDYDRGVKSDTKVNDDGTTITSYSFKEVEARSYCKKHHGMVNIDGELYEYFEECVHE